MTDVADAPFARLISEDRGGRAESLNSSIYKVGPGTLPAADVYEEST